MVHLWSMRTSSTEPGFDLFTQTLLAAEEAAADLRYEEALQQVLEALKFAEDRLETLNQSRAHAEHSRILSKLSLFAEAVTSAHAALRLAHGDPASEARALGVLGTANQTLLPPEAHVPIYELMLDKARQAGDKELEASGIRGLCISHLIRHQLDARDGTGTDDAELRGHADAALTLAREATRLCQIQGDKERTFLGRHLQVGALMKAGDMAEARRESESMLHAAEDLQRSDMYRAITLKLLGQIELEHGELSAAEERITQALVLFEEGNDLRPAADCFNTLSEICEAKGEYKAALGWLRRGNDAFTRFASASARAHAAAMEVREGAERARALAATQQARADRLERSNQELSREALEDALTGIGNRRGLDIRLAALFADQRGRRRCSLALLDIDRFKWVNDTFLHTTGDKVLTRIGAVLRECSREKDVVARFGGEEFAVAFVDIDPTEVAAACERIRAAIAGVLWAEFHPDLVVTVSVGFGHFDEADESVEELVKVASGCSKRSMRVETVWSVLAKGCEACSQPLAHSRHGPRTSKCWSVRSNTRPSSRTCAREASSRRTMRRAACTGSPASTCWPSCGSLGRWRLATSTPFTLR